MSDQYIYFIEMTGLVKIGVTGNVQKRFREISNYVPFETALLGVMNGDDMDEEKIQRSIKHLRFRGEWFTLTDRLREWILANSRPMALQKPRQNRHHYKIVGTIPGWQPEIIEELRAA